MVEDNNNIKKNISSLGSLATQVKPWETEPEQFQAVLEPEVRTGETKVPIKAIYERSDGQITEINTTAPVLNKFKERITKTMAATNFDEGALYLVQRMDYVGSDLQDISEQEEDMSKLDFTPTVSKLAEEIEFIAQSRKSLNGWAVEILQTRKLNQNIMERTEQKVEDAVNMEKKKKWILF